MKQLLRSIKKLKQSMFRKDPSGAPRWKKLFSQLLFRRKLPGRVEGALFYLRYKISESLLPLRRLFRSNRRRPKVFVDLKEGLGDRYLFQLLSFFSFEGYHVEFFTNRSDQYFRRLEYGRLIYTLKNLRIVNEFPENTEDTILCFDEEDPRILGRKWKKRIFINQDISLNRSGREKALIIPYSMHPVIYKLKHHERLVEFRSNKRMIRIIFSGMHGPDYQHSTMPDQFNKISRPRAVEVIISSGVASIIGARRDIGKLLNGEYKNKFVFIDTEKTVIFQEHWLDTISRSDFFLALPGDVRPMCHNIIEAMAVGTIPITNYPEWFHPCLGHMENCIVFDSEEDLIHKIKSVLEMEPEKIKKMRQEVIKYYEKHLSPSSFVKLVESSDDDPIEVFFNSGNREYLSRVNRDSVIISQKEEKNE